MDLRQIRLLRWALAPALASLLGCTAGFKTADATSAATVTSASTSQTVVPQSITNVGSTIAGAGAMTVAAGGTNQNLTLSGSGTGNVLLSANVGIGTLTPATALDLNGALSVRGMSAPSASATGQGRMYFDSTSNQFMVSQNGGGYLPLATGGGAGTGLAVATNASVGGTFTTGGAANLNGGLTVAGNAVVSGNLGVGTASPDQKLTVAGGSIGIDNAQWIYGKDAAGARRTLLTQWSDNNTYLDGGAAGLYLRTNNATVNAMRIDAAGNIGIGTNSPKSTLDVNGTVNLAQICDRSGANCVTPAGLIGAAANVPSLATVTAAGGSTASPVSFSGGVSTSAISSSGEFVGTMATGAGQARWVGGNYGLIERNDGANFYMLLTNSGSPMGSWNGLRPFTINDASGDVSLGTNLTVGANASTGGSQTIAGSLTAGGATNLKGSLTVAGNTVLGGNVGIGTSAPQSTLDVNGTVNLAQICDRSGANCITPAGLVGAASAVPSLASVTAAGASTSAPVSFGGGVSTSGISSSGEIVGTMASGAGQARWAYGNYGVIERNDGANFYMLLTDSGNPMGSFNGLRPFTMSDATGDISLGTNLSVGGNAKINGSQTLGGNLSFSAANPTLSASSYLVVPGGAYFNSGTVYTEATLQARGGVSNDTNPALRINGGSSGFTFFPNNTGMGTASPGARLEIAQTGSQPALSVGEGGNDDSPTYGMVNLTRPADTTRAHLAFIRTGNFVWQTGYVKDTNTLGFFPWTFSGGSQGVPTLAMSGSNVGIGTATPGSTLTVAGNGSFTQTVTAPNFTMTSDRRLKEKIKPLSAQLDRILKLDPVSFQWNKLAHDRGNTDSSKQIGFIAQDIEKVYPEAVQTAKDGFKSVGYATLISPLIAAFKEFFAMWRADHDHFEQELKAKDARIAELEKRLGERLDKIEKKLQINQK